MIEPLDQAAARLEALLQGRTWFWGVGIGKDGARDCLYVYTNRRISASERRDVPSSWEGHPVRAIAMGGVKPLTAG